MRLEQRMINITYARAGFPVLLPGFYTLIRLAGYQVKIGGFFP